MFQTKVAVDRHVQELFRKVKDEKERNLRCYNLAKLYYQVEDYESARRYVSSYLEVKDTAPAHKLLGQIYEALGQKEQSLNEYKQSLTLDGRQDDLVLKMCELLNEVDNWNVNIIKYWVDRGAELFPHHPTVFQLKEKMLNSDRSAMTDDLETLITSELAARPLDVNLRVKLIKYYMSKRRMEDAYKNAVEIECSHAHHQSLTWYECLYDLLAKMKECKNLKWCFWVFLVTASERYAALSLTEHGDKVKSIVDAQQILLNFDQVLHEAKSKISAAQDANLAEKMFNHMWGQLNYYLACFLLRKAKREQKNWPETVRLCGPLLFSAVHSAIIDPEASWSPTMKSQALLWFKEGSYRCSQAGHVLNGYCRDNHKLIDKIGDCMTNSWRENTFRKIFGQHNEQLVNSSHFVQNPAANPPLRLLSTTEHKRFDEVAKKIHPDSLHHHVWLGIAHKKILTKSPIGENEPYPNQHSIVFSGLQFSVYNLHQASPDSLGILDLDAFLNATILCSLKHVLDQANGGLLNPERMPVLPADLTNTLCTIEQEKWWNLAYKMYKKQEISENNNLDTRKDLQTGIEAIRCIGNHGLHLNILVHLGRIFKYRAKMLMKKDKNHPNLSFIVARAEIYWAAAVPLIERLLNNQQVRMFSNKMFDYQGKDMSNSDLNEALEEGYLLIAEKHMREIQYEQAINVLQSLKCPEASFYQGDIYEKLAQELIESLPKEAITDSIKEQHMIMLTKAKNCYYLTLDRLRSPFVSSSHPLNAELGTRLANIEDQLCGNDASNDNDNTNDSFTSAHSLTEILPSSTFNHRNSSASNLQKSNRLFNATNVSTPRTPKHNIESPLKNQIPEARPSPERLDAQIRQLFYSQNNVIHNFMDQQKALIESTKQLEKMVTEMRKELSELRLDSSSPRRRTRSVSTANHVEDDQSYAYEEDFGDMSYGIAANISSVQPPTTPAQANPPVNPAIPPTHIPGNMFTPRQYSSLMYQNPQHTGYYQGLAFTDYAQQSLQSFYPPSVYQIPSLYPRATEQTLGLPRYPESLQQGMMTPNLFNSRSMPMFPDLVSPQQQQPQQQQSLPMTNLDMSRGTAAVIPGVGVSIPGLGNSGITGIPHNTGIVQNVLNIGQTISNIPSIPSVGTPSNVAGLPIVSTIGYQVPSTTTIKNTFSNKTPPVNVVITSSDTLPTSAPSVQPTLSIIIPAHHRNVSSTVIAGSNQNLQSTVTTSAPHNYQILMPSHATIPTTPSIFNSVASVNHPVTPISVDKNSSVLSATSHNSSTDAVEVEHDPIPDFVPVIPLPAEIKVTTGEEDEEELFCVRAKLYRYVETEWKDRGVGNVKLLKNKEGKVRLLMRREQVLKICANHLLTPDMELSAMPSNNKAWIWAANDYADEELKLEKLCIRFKLVEEAQAFKDAFDKAKKSIPVETTKHVDESSNKFVPETQSKIDNKSGSVKVGGFTFSSTPVIQPSVASDQAKQQQQQQQQETTKPSPFAAFQFTKTTDPVISVATTPFSSFSIIKTTASSDTKEPIISTTAAKTPATVGVTTSTSNASKPPLRRPHSVTSPSPSNEITGFANDDDNDVVLFDKTATLMRSVGESKQWKDRGPGSLNLILTTKTGKLKLLMKKADASKTLVDMIITKTCSFVEIGSAPNIVCWFSPTLTSSGKQDKYAVSFKESSESTEFLDKISKLQKLMVDNKVPPAHIFKNGKNVSVKLEITQTSSATSSASIKPLSEMFKSAVGSWECSSCYMRNKPGSISCVACNEPAPSSATSTATSTSTPLFAANNQVPLSQLCKPPPNSWECKTCYIRNTKANKYCVACDSPSDPSMPQKPKINDIGGGATFKFGTQHSATSSITTTSSTTPSTTSFSFGSTTPTFGTVFGANSQATQAPMSFGDLSKNQPKSSLSFGQIGTTTTTSFGFSAAESTTTTSGFSFKAPGIEGKPAGPLTGDTFVSSSPSAPLVFGNTNKLVTPSIGISFGSPGKSFDFQLTSRSPVKSPGGAEGSEDEVAESEDVYFDPVVPLPDKIEVKTGEENEQVLYKHRAKLFRYHKATKEWKERGLGDIKLLKHQETNKLRLVMRREQTLKLCLNHFVTRDIEISVKDEKTWMWNAADYSDGDIEYVQLACRFKSSDIANEFKKAIEDALETLSVTLGTEQSFNEAEISKQSTTFQEEGEEESATDVQVVFQLQVTREEKDAALKLQLPQNFYSYKQKKDCPGCIGCKEPEILLFVESSEASKTLATSISSVKLTPPKLTPPPATTPATSTTPSSTPQQTMFSGKGSLFSGSPTITSTTTTSTTSIFGNSMTTSTAKSFSFGLPKASSEATPVFAGKTTSETTPVFGTKTSPETKPIFGAKTTLETAIFGAKPTTEATPIFWEKLDAPASGDKGFIFGRPTRPASGVDLTSVFAAGQTACTPTSGFTLDFGKSQAFSSNSAAQPATTTSFTTIFNSAAPKSDAVSNATISATISTTSLATSGNIFLNSTTSAKPSLTSIFGGNATQLGQLPKNEESNAFLNTDNSLSFSNLAAKADQPVGFKTDPNFSFAGAGQSVFGSSVSKNQQEKSEKTQKKPRDDEDDGEGDKGGDDDNQEYDPHYEPIIPLPDQVEVRTGEEDEEKMFCQRAKLYRYEDETKEWKERGVGEMKVLYHSGHGSYRLLLRREQVHKVVCNFLITVDLELLPLTTSDCSWTWVGMNYVDDHFSAEKLAVRFKNAQLANEFKDTVEKAKSDLRERPQLSIQECKETEDDAENVDPDYQVEEEDEEDEQSLMFDRSAVLFLCEDGNWIEADSGQIRVVYDSDIFGARIIFITVDGEEISNCVITVEAEMKVENSDCIWTAIDDSYENPTRRQLRAHFSTEAFARDLLETFQEGQDYARQAGISERMYYEDT